MKMTNMGFEISLDKDIQPLKDITITISYGTNDVSGFNESKLALARYDSGNLRWIPITSSADTVNKKVSSTTNHLSKFAVFQPAVAANLDKVKAYPNPFNPSRGTLTIGNLTTTANIKIYDVAGELIRKVDYLSEDGKAAWDGKNDNGNTVASGVYIIYVGNSQGKKNLKIAVER
jgi:hypothetical protein